MFKHHKDLKKVNFYEEENKQSERMKANILGADKMKANITNQHKVSYLQSHMNDMI